MTVAVDVTVAVERTVDAEVTVDAGKESNVPKDIKDSIPCAYRTPRHRAGSC